MRLLLFYIFMKKIVCILILSLFLFQSAWAYSDYYLFWLRLQDNDYEIATNIESQFNLNIPLVSVIYDDFDTWDQLKLAKTFKTLWKDKVYHVDVNPFGYSLKELIEDKDHKGWEKKYKTLFKIIKKAQVKVIFRFLHEMNWWWYSWSSDSYRFPIFWKMVWNWSREEWLDRSNILFDFSVNSQDLPAVEWSMINQWAPVVTCNQTEKIKTWCKTFEDYYPWDDYVDVVWVTMYNWWKWARKESWASWRWPTEVVNEPWYWAFDRLKKMWKPIFIDEAWSTSINIDEPFDNSNLINIYNSTHYWIPWYPANWIAIKNTWIEKLKKIYEDPQVIGWAYFNADVTYWFTDRSKIWELDWTAVDTEKNFIYKALIDISNDQKNKLSPILYFDLPEKLLSTKKWITDEEMYTINEYISKYIYFPEWDILSSSSYFWTQSFSKYQYLLENTLNGDPIMCSIIHEKFPKILCDSDNNIKNTEIITKISLAKRLMSMIDSSSVKLSRWWIWQQIEDLKNIIAYWSKKTWKINVALSANEYLDFYKKKYLRIDL